MSPTSLMSHTANDAALKALLEVPTAVVAAAYRSRATEVAGVTLTVAVLARLADALECATGVRAFALEHMRDRRPLGEMLEVSQLVTAQRRVLAAA